MYVFGTFVGTTLHCAGEKKTHKKKKNTEGTIGSASWQRSNVVTDEAKDSTNTGAECLCFDCAPIKIESRPALLF